MAVTDAVSLILLSVALFASTNLDDMFVLAGFFAAPSFHGRDVLIGQFLGMAALTLTSVGLAATAVMVPREVVGLLGMAPVFIGVRAFRRALVAGSDEGSQQRSSRSGILAVVAVTIANGGDNLAAYVPVFAQTPSHGLLIIGMVFTAMTGVWCWFAHYLVSHPMVGAPVRRYGGRAFPLMLVMIGLNVLRSSGLIHWVARHVGLG